MTNTAIKEQTDLDERLSVLQGEVLISITELHGRIARLADRLGISLPDTGISQPEEWTGSYTQKLSVSIGGLRRLSEESHGMFNDIERVV